MLTARGEDGLRESLALCEGGQGRVFAADLTSREEIGALAEFVREECGTVDVLINNAAVALYAPSFEAKPEDVEYLVRLNLLAPIELTRRVLPLMPAGGSVVNVSSIAGKVPLPWLTTYSSTKFGLCAFSDGLRMELEGTDIHVMTVCPGFMETDFRTNAIVGEIPSDVAGNKKFMIPVAECAETILRGIERRKRTIITPGIGRALLAAVTLFPGTVFARMGKMANPAQLLLGARRGS